MAVVNFVKRIQDVMRNDAGVNGDAQRIEQIVWTLFLKIYEIKYNQCLHFPSLVLKCN